MRLSRHLLVAMAATLLAGCAKPTPPASQTYLIFFEKWSAQLDDGAQSTISSAAGLAKRQSSAPVTVLGYADPEGSPQANREVSALRAQMVVDGLVAAGVPRDRILRRAVGSVEYSADSIEARRVEIDIGKT